MRDAYQVDCQACGGSGKVTIPPEIDTLDVFYFGCWKGAGHYLTDPDNAYRDERSMESLLPEELRRGRLDGGFCPGRVKGDPYKRTRPEVEGEAMLSHVKGWTVLGWWDRSVDNRGACNSNIVAQGTHDFTTMLEIGRRRMPHVIERQRQGIKLVEKLVEKDAAESSGDSQRSGPAGGSDG